jgi:hypothetical protein
MLVSEIESTKSLEISQAQSRALDLQQKQINLEKRTYNSKNPESGKTRSPARSQNSIQITERERLGMYATTFEDVRLG